MVDRFVGIGGNDGNNGLTWANRKLTLNGAEDTPVVAGDTVYVGPGVYREMLTVDVTGAGGNPITYIGDVTGENTDGIGGVVRITGSDNDQTKTRTNCIVGSSGEDYRTFRGFCLDMTTSTLLNATSCDSWIIEDCYFGEGGSWSIVIGGTSTDWEIRRCLILGSAISGAQCIQFNDLGAGDQSNVGHVIENCIFFAGGTNDIIEDGDIGGITFRNCYLRGGGRAFDIDSLAGGQTITIENCILVDCNIGFDASVAGEITEDFNSLYNVNTARVNTGTGADSETFPPLLEQPILFDGIIFPWNWLAPSEWSQLARRAGSSEPADDFFGIARPTTSSKKSWGAVQFRPGERETGTTRGGSTASIILSDAGDHQIFVPVDDTEMTISVYVYREANYAGVNPRMIIKEPGQADRVTTDAAAASQWNQLTDTFTPQSTSDYVVVVLRSLNTNGANDSVFFDDLEVS